MSPARNCAVLVAGEYFCDLVFTGLEGAPRLGAEHMATDLAIMPGGTYTMALALTRLGVDTRWANTFGNDLFSRYVLEQTQQDGIDATAFTIVDMPVQRVSVAYAGDGERGFISFSAPPVAAPPPEIADRFHPQFLLQTFRFEPEWRAFVAARRAAGATCLLDCRGGDFTLETEGVAGLIALADIFSPNAEEAIGLTGEVDLDRAAAKLLTLAPVIVIKCGADGARLYQASGSSTHPAPRVAVVDTVGAGDAFNAGLLSGLVAGLDLAQAVERAVICGALSTTAVGGRACPNASQLALFIDRHQHESTPAYQSVRAVHH